MQGCEELELELYADVLRKAALFEATTSQPWLALRFRHAVPAGKWVTLSYRTSLFDPLLRPVIRFEIDQVQHDVTMPAGLFGRTTWTGRIPDRTQAVFVCPVAQKGRFGFALDGLVIRRRPSLLLQAFASDAHEALVGLSLRTRGSVDNARQHIIRALEGCNIDRYHEWRKRRERPLDLNEVDLPRHDWANGAHIRYVCRVRRADTAFIEATLAGLGAQPYDNWSLALVCNGPLERTSPIESAEYSGRIVFCAPTAPAIQLLRDGTRPLLMAPLEVGSVIPSYAPAVLAEYSAAHPDKHLIYADEDELDPRQRYVNPKLKPDWSPIYQEASSYLGNALYIREAIVASAQQLAAGDLARCRDVASLFHRASAAAIGHLRRVTVSVSYGGSSTSIREPLKSAPLGGAKYPGASEQSAAAARPADPQATIIIPSKDRPDLLRACLAGLWRTQLRDFQLIIVDNGSRDPATFKLYEDAAKDPRFLLLRAPGPFNFAEMCNAATKHAKAPYLAFLNNDIELPDSSWLTALLSYATMPLVGAVAPKLLYPSGRVQHAGLVIGLGGHAAHIDAGAPGESPGYMDRLVCTHEVSAVTGACLVVAKSKFDAVGGFDAVNFPVELNDVDLCLRLQERGWASLLVAECSLIHHESATRGSKPKAAYQKEHQAFASRWRAAIRDDTFFHPGLALWSRRTALA